MPEQAPARSSLLFSRDALLRLIIPLVIEQLLLMTVGMADTVMVTTAGEAAVSSVVDRLTLADLVRRYHEKCSGHNV